MRLCTTNLKILRAARRLFVQHTEGVSPHAEGVSEGSRGSSEARPPGPIQVGLVHPGGVPDTDSRTRLWHPSGVHGIRLARDPGVACRRPPATLCDRFAVVTSSRWVAGERSEPALCTSVLSASLW